MNHLQKLTILHDGVPLCLVPHEPDNAYLFYVSRDGTIGLRISPKGVESLQNALPTTWPNNADASNANRKQRYLMYKQAWGGNLGILVSRAVWLAWSGKSIPEGYEMHHLNGITTDNRLENIICLSREEHLRYNAVQRSLRMSGRLEKMTSEEILSVTQKYILDPRPLDARMKSEPFRDFDPFIERDDS